MLLIFVNREEIFEAARRRKESTQVEMEYQQLLRFCLDKDWYGISIENVVEVIKCPKIFNVPYTPDYVVGVINLRGEILAVIEIKRILGLPATDSDNKKFVVVIERGKTRFGILVDRASDVVSIPNSTLESPLSDDDSADNLIAGEAQLQGALLAILNPDKLLEV